MRKIALLILISVLAAACGDKAAVEENGIDKQPFTSKAELIWQDKSYECEMERSDSESLKITLKGDNLHVPICFEITQGGYRAAQGELEYSMPFEDMQPQSAAAEIYRTFMLLGQAEAERTGNIITYKVSSSVLKYDEKANVITSLETENGKLTFKDFAFNGKPE
jgi:hypothetical protein